MSAAGSSAISGASRWLAASAFLGAEAPVKSARTASATAVSATSAMSGSRVGLRTDVMCPPFSPPSVRWCSPEKGDRFGVGEPPIWPFVRTASRSGSRRTESGVPREPRVVSRPGAEVGLTASTEERAVRRDLAHLSDEAVVALAARGEGSALGELYDRFGRVAYGLALRVVRDPTLAEDAVQEAFLDVWRGAGRFIPERAKASTWILTFVHRRAVDVVRREQRRRTDPADA